MHVDDKHLEEICFYCDLACYRPADKSFSSLSLNDRMRKKQLFSTQRLNCPAVNALQLGLHVINKQNIYWPISQHTQSHSHCQGRVESFPGYPACCQLTHTVAQPAFILTARACSVDQWLNFELQKTLWISILMVLHRCSNVKKIPWRYISFRVRRRSCILPLLCTHWSQTSLRPDWQKYRRTHFKLVKLMTLSPGYLWTKS